MAFGAIGMMGSQRLTHLAGHAAVLSSGTLAAGLRERPHGRPATTCPAHVLAVGALFRWPTWIDRWRNDGTTLAPYERRRRSVPSPELVPTAGLNLTTTSRCWSVASSRPPPPSWAWLNLMCTLVIASCRRVAASSVKFATLTALLNPLGLGSSAGTRPGPG